ncbi:MAG TPA: 3-dehydroquinate synthase, partial [Planctomycetaceae bacterium]|nr:3-dehydroquinate synthase [Planctomycetaceae bacterium]
STRCDDSPGRHSRGTRSRLLPEFARVATAEQTVCVSLGPRTYEILIGSNLLPQTATLIWRWHVQHAGKPPASPRGLIVTDSHVADLHAATVQSSLRDAGWKTETVVLPAGEPSKSLEVIATVYDRLIDWQADRQTVVFAVGGGVVGDAAGFIAATYTRGVPFVQVPTTLLADVDSSVGGKVGVNHPRAKNMIGAFYQPMGVLIDTGALATLPDREYRSGLAEVVKYGVILDSDLFAELESFAAELNAREPQRLARVIARSCRLKADIVEKDEFERTGLRAALNYGHTFAHAFEALCGYGELLHGEAVSIGMVCASRLAERRGLIDRSVTARQVRLLEEFHLPVTLPTTTTKFSADDAIGRMRLDKKAIAGQLRFVLPTRLGHVETIAQIPETDVRAVLAAIGVD